VARRLGGSAASAASRRKWLGSLGLVGGGNGSARRSAAASLFGAQWSAAAHSRSASLGARRSICPALGVSMLGGSASRKQIKLFRSAALVSAS